MTPKNTKMGGRERFRPPLIITGLYY